MPSQSVFGRKCKEYLCTRGTEKQRACRWRQEASRHRSRNWRDSSGPLCCPGHRYLPGWKPEGSASRTTIINALSRKQSGQVTREHFVPTLHVEQPRSSIKQEIVGIQSPTGCEKWHYLPECEEDNHFDHGKLQQRIEGCQKLMSSQVK